MAYFTVAEARAEEPDLANEDEFPDGLIERARSLAEEAFEHAAGVAFVPRTATETLSGSGTQKLIVSHPRIRALTALSIGGSSVSIEGIRVFALRGLYREAGWPVGVANIEITYEHGYEQPPLEVRGAVMTLAKVRAIDGPFDERALQEVQQDVAVAIAVPGFRGSVEGIPEVDKVLRRYRHVSVRLA